MWLDLIKPPHLYKKWKPPLYACVLGGEDEQMTEIVYGGRGKFMPTTGHQRWMVFWKRNQSHTWLHTLQVHSDLMGGKGKDQGSCTALIARYIVMYHSALRMWRKTW